MTFINDNIIPRPKTSPIIPPITLATDRQNEWLELPFCKVKHKKLCERVIKARRDFINRKKELRRFKTIQLSNMLVGEKATFGAEFSRREYSNEHHNFNGYDIDLKFKKEFHYTNPQRRWRTFIEEVRCHIDHKLSDTEAMDILWDTLVELQKDLSDVVVRRNKYPHQYADTHGEYAPKEDDHD